jgi:hypothetical protein
VLRNKLGGAAIDLKKLFTTQRTLQALFHFIAATNRFHDTFGDIPTLPETEQREKERR